MKNLFGKRLREIRKRREFTQEELGSRCGACAGAIRDWEKGLRLPNTYYLREICVALNVSADYLLGLRKKSKPDKRRNKGCMDI